MSLSWNHGCQRLLLRDEDYVQSVIKQACVCACVCKHNPRGCICNLRAHSLMPRCLLSLTRHYGLSVAVLPVMTSSCSPLGPMANLRPQLTCCALTSDGACLVRKQRFHLMFDRRRGQRARPHLSGLPMSVVGGVEGEKINLFGFFKELLKALSVRCCCKYWLESSYICEASNMKGFQ